MDEYGPNPQQSYPLLDEHEGSVTHRDGLQCHVVIVGPAKDQPRRYVVECLSTGRRYLVNYWSADDEITLAAQQVWTLSR